DRARPTMIVTKTHIGYGAPKKQDTAKAHGEPLGKEEIAGAKAFYGWPSMKAYRDQVLPRGVPRIAIEAAHPASWYRLVGEQGEVLGLSRFGASAPYETVYRELGITVDRLVEAAKAAVSA
ncbi:MAG: transketolase-like TK C-terminal-containing protein, partial [Minisyncoccota bacterium]